MDVLIKDIIHNNFAVTTDDGDKIFSVLNNSFHKKESVILNFKGITLLTTAFLNSAIGQLYSNANYSSSFLNDNISIINVNDSDKHLFQLVITRAKEYFANKENFERKTRDSIYGKD